MDKDLKLIIDLGDDLAGCEIKDGENTADWNNLELDDKVRIVNTLWHFWSLFGRSLKVKGGDQ